METVKTITNMSIGNVEYDNALTSVVIEPARESLEHVNELIKSAKEYATGAVKVTWTSFNGGKVEKCMIQWQQGHYRNVDVVWVKRGIAWT